MAEELDTSWFDLKNYEVFKTMSIEEWQRQFVIRCLYRDAYLERQTHDFVRIYNFEPNAMFIHKAFHDEADKYLLSLANILKAGAIPYDPNYFDRFQFFAMVEGDPFSTTSVSSIPSDSLYSKVDYALNIKQSCPMHTMLKTDVEIDLSATDEQIKEDFSQWLINYRNSTDIKANKKLITQANFDYWIQYGVIPYLDLVLIAKIEGKKITQPKLANLIFPDEYDVGIEGRLRQVTKPEAERLIKNNIHRTLSTQSAYEKTGMKNA